VPPRLYACVEIKIRKAGTGACLLLYCFISSQHSWKTVGTSYCSLEIELKIIAELTKSSEAFFCLFDGLMHQMFLVDNKYGQHCPAEISKAEDNVSICCSAA